MEIKFNLLPQGRKKKIQKSNILRFVVWQEVVIIFIVLFFFAIVQSINFIIELQLNEAEQMISSQKRSVEYKEVEKYEKYLGALNKKVFAVKRAQLNNADWYEILKKISNLIPEGVVLNKISIDEFEVSIGGVAESRNNLIEMKKMFSGDDCFVNVEIPLNDIVLKNDIDFELDFKIKRECLFKKYE